jgi:hypothetical protein
MKQPRTNGFDIDPRAIGPARVCISGVQTTIRHTVTLPPCCPVSGNPLPGSTLRIRYRAADRVLPVEWLEAEAAAYIGGRDPIRNMEELVQDFAQRCAREALVPVTVLFDGSIRTPSARACKACA